MAASEGRLPSLPPPFCVSLDGAEGVVGIRSFATSFPLANGAMGLSMSIACMCM